MTNQEHGSTEQDKTAVCNSNIKHNKKKSDIDFEMEKHKCCSIGVPEQ